jgi:uncharacterized membrane protein YozB (DUF420 family)
MMPPAGPPNELAARVSAPQRLYSYAALCVAALVFAGFAPSYYLRAFVSARHLTPLAHIHGALMTAWIVLFATQATLIRKGRIAWHRRLGVGGAVLAAVIVIVGSLTVAAAAERRFPAVGPARFARIFVEFDGLSLWVFGALVLAAVLWRRRSDVHRRLILCATVALLPPAVGRLAEHLQFGSDAANLALAAVTTGAFVLLCALADALRLGRLHPAMTWGAAAVLAANLLTQLAQVGD